MYSLDDTIAAIATSIGYSGVGIIKVSGPESRVIARQLFRSAKGLTDFQPYRLHYGQIVDPVTNQPVDEALVVYMPKPHSYTCQDIIEIQAHGGIMPLRRILQLVLSRGARLAEAGEMTLRAFLNGRLDLAQAEAVLDIIEAKTDAALRVANEQLGGTLSAQVKGVRANLLNTLAYLEASIDFVEDEIPLQAVVPPLESAAGQLDTLVQSADYGQIYRQGVRAAIVGRPNVGKSSLLNALLRGNRAIVTDIPGTTRDTLEETVNVDGIPLVLVDTAGIRAQVSDEVERIGVDRSRAALNRADIALMVIDSSMPLEEADWEIAAAIGKKSAILVINKTDLTAANTPNNPSKLLPDAPRVHISALTLDGIDTLESQITDIVFSGGVTPSDTPLVSNPRHKALLEQSLGYVKSAIAAYEAALSADLVSIDVRGAVESLGEITGETVTEDLLDTIFSNFCIGK